MSYTTPAMWGILDAQWGTELVPQKVADWLHNLFLEGHDCFTNGFMG